MNSGQTMATPRTSMIARVVLSLVVALLLGTMLVPSVDASKKGKNTIQSVSKRVGNLRELCGPGNTFSSKKTAFGTRTKCTDSDGTGTKCTVHKKYTKCQPLRTQPPDTGSVAPPSGGVEEPSGGVGGNNAGGGAAVSPGGGIEDPTDPPPGEPVLH